MEMETYLISHALVGCLPAHEVLSCLFIFRMFLLNQFTYVATSLCWIALHSLLAANSYAMTYFIAPSGFDSNAGTSASTPWKTFEFAVARLNPGDTLVLLNGRYRKTANGHLSVTGKNGSSSNPITFKAQNQRLAHLDGDGMTGTMRIDNSSYLVFDGLQVSSQDNPNAVSAPDPITARNSHHLTFENMLIHHNNRYRNSHLMELNNVTNSLIENTELYYHHRHGILVYRSDHNTFRRLYCNSRGYGSIPGGFKNGHGAVGGDVCVSIYPGSDNLLENMISDGPQTPFDIQAIAPSRRNRILGVVGIGSWYGGVMRARGNTGLEQPVNNLIKDLVVINAESVGVYARGAKGTQCDQCTIIGSGNSGILADVEPGITGDGKSSFYATNSLSLNNKHLGFGIVQTDWMLEFPNSYNNGAGYSPRRSPYQVNKTARDPQLGQCRVYLPDESPMRGAGKNGADIGANVLFRYEGGQLTNIPLWDPVTGQFPCGAIVPGVNDVPGNSCFDVHQRLNVNTSGCSFPSGFRKRVAEH